MGLCIYYKGVFNAHASLTEMIAEVEDVAKAYSWDYHVFETSFPAEDKIANNDKPELFGISFSPPQSEAVWLCFYQNKKTGSPMSIVVDGEKALDTHDHTSTKTQYAGWRVHQVIIHLLRYLSEKYFSEFELIDESRYWETNDEAVLISNFNKYNAIIESFASALEHIPVNKGEGVEDYLKRLFEIIQKRK